jgi:hypothetical protein
MSLPRLLPLEASKPDGTDAVVLVVYAPFGGDETLSSYPDGATRDLAQHPLMHALLESAQSGVHVVALVDLYQQDSFLVEIPAGKPADLRVSSRWKQDMGAHQTLTGLLIHAHRCHPGAALVLTIEGHGAGFLPDIDTAQLSSAHLTTAADGRPVVWTISGSGAVPTYGNGGAPVLPVGSPVLPVGSPVLGVGQMPLSTWALGAALQAAVAAGVPRIAVIHLDNCFNLSVEVLHTLAPFADFATGYPNYNFFTAGQPYAAVFHKLQALRTATREQLANWFSEANHEILLHKGHHPTVGGVVRLSRMHGIVEAIDDLADALLSALRSASAADRPAVVEAIRQAIAAAQQYDSDGNFAVEVPDQLTDIRSFAHQLLKHDFGAHPVAEAATALSDRLAGIKHYGDDGRPWMDESKIWPFGDPMLSMNILLPDPCRKGEWDWRSPYYLDVNPDPARPPVQPHIIDFVKVTDWVDFIIEYHKGVAFKALLPARPLAFPHFNPAFKPGRVPPQTTPGTGGQTPGGTVTPPRKG